MTQEAHTPEPWHVDAFGCHNDYRLRVCEPMRNGFPLATIAQFEFNWRDAGQFDRQISYKEAEGNARRAAACVNALAGIPIEAIESGVVAELKEYVVAFGGPWAVQYSRDFGLPAGHLHPTHYDILEKCGARMNDFTRAKLEASK